MIDHLRALTTGQAAKYCFVTADTIANWIRSGLLRAQRTAGGQYRILIGDLREFMISQGMTVDQLDREAPDRPSCWEFHAAADGAEPAACEECVVRFLGVRDCFKLMGMRSGARGAGGDCAGCDYFRRWGPAEPDGNRKPKTPPDRREEGG
jgi:excisionase family DNA binding protein